MRPPRQQRRRDLIGERTALGGQAFARRRSFCGDLRSCFADCIRSASVRLRNLPRLIFQQFAALLKNMANSALSYFTFGAY